MSEIREWVVYREFTTRQVFTGIKARSKEEALAEWHRGGGDIDLDREQHSSTLDAVSVKVRATEELVEFVDGKRVVCWICKKPLHKPDKAERALCAHCATGGGLGPYT